MDFWYVNYNDYLIKLNVLCCERKVSDIKSSLIIQTMWANEMLNKTLLMKKISNVVILC